MNIFISYSSQNRNLVETLAEDLEVMGYTVWFDRELTGGRKWWADILEQIRACDLFVFALAPQSLDSHPCKLEYTYAHALQKRILPIMVAQVPVKNLPATLQEIQLVDYCERNREQALKLNKAFNNLPPALSLPDPLPAEPETPLPPLAILRDKLEALSLTAEEQAFLVFELKGFLEEKESKAEAKHLLELFKERKDLLARVEKEINSLLSISPSGVGKTRSAKVELPEFRHPDTVMGIAFSPDGNYIATGGLDGKARVWGLTERQEIVQFPHKHTIHSIAYSPDGNMVLVGCEDRIAHLWDVNTGQSINRFVGHSSTIQAVQFSSDSRYVLTGSSDFTARLWDARSGECLRIFSGHKDTVLSAVFSPDERYVLTGSEDTTARLWNVATWDESRKYDGFEFEITSAAFALDGQSILLARGDGVVKLDVQTGNVLCEFNGHRKEVRRLAVSPDGTRLLTGSRDRTARLWDVAKGREAGTFSKHTGSVLTVAFSPDGTIAASAGTDRTLYLWDVEAYLT